MSETRIYHNPRCSKSRQTLQLLQDQGITPEVREYLKDPLNAEELRELLAMLGISARALLRTKEAEYAEAGLANPELDDAAVIEAICRYPKLMERPIVVHQGQARIGRPPEQVLELF
ncbi:Arsenate reductase [Nitrincola lacisaponensis]|uniref:Arsenate reductase n=1 Tax=Nitrincola lacisaponensis TaxID=267850 RepID=A0A063XYD8_9GAMM|nr:arsenate reductase (glutaredoxin) [Nitrincola lacisaponensis]KDE38494.1 Arsenate reductase [Nitrincola lacisaponensis]